MRSRSLPQPRLFLKWRKACSHSKGNGAKLRNVMCVVPRCLSKNSAECFNRRPFVDASAISFELVESRLHLDRDSPNKHVSLEHPHKGRSNSVPANPKIMDVHHIVSSCGLDKCG